MSQDPNSAYGSNPQNPYGAPQDPYSTPQNPYGPPPQNPPENPYGVPPQNPYGPPPQNPYGGQQVPYPIPQQNPYGVPPQNPYGPPPQSGQYGQYGAQGYGPPPMGFHPLPLNEAVRQLPQQYIKALTKPSVASFAEELPKAGWDITWIQLLFFIVIAVVLNLISALINSSLIRERLVNTPYASTLSLLTTATTAGAAVFSIIIVPAFFFANTGLQYLLARAFGGRGSFLGQSYTNLLFLLTLSTIPAGLIYGILRLILTPIPVAGTILSLVIALALMVYGIILNIFQIQASHGLTRGKATATVLLPYLIYILLGVLCGVVFGLLIVAINSAR